MIIIFPEDIANIIAALDEANSRLLALAERLGASSRDVALIRATYEGAMEDVRTAFGLGATLAIPYGEEAEFITIHQGGQLAVHGREKADMPTR